MNNLIFGGVLSFLITISLTSNAQQPSHFVRKPLPAPEFFVPKNDTEHQEKLPPFNLPKVATPDTAPQSQTHEQIKQDEPIFEMDIKEEPIEASPQDEFNPNLDVTVPAIPPQSSGLNETTPKYKQEYATYLRDLKVIAETGQAPHNQELDKDLAKMNHNQRLEVDSNGRIINPFQQSQLVNPMAYAPDSPRPPQKTAAQPVTTKILDQVEIIRRPHYIEENNQSPHNEENIENPFAQPEESPIAPAISEPEIPAAPETIAHFGGINPFVGDESDSDDVEQADEDETESEDELTPLPLLESEADKVNDEPQPADFQPEIYQPEPQVSRSYRSGGGKTSSSSYSRSSNIVR